MFSVQLLLAVTQVFTARCYALVRGSHFRPTLFAVVVCPALAICTAPTPHKTITALYRLALWVLLMIGDGGLVVPDNPG